MFGNLIISGFRVPLSEWQNIVTVVQRVNPLARDSRMGQCAGMSPEQSGRFVF